MQEEITLFMKFITVLGSKAVLVPAAVIAIYILYKRKNQQTEAFMIFAVLLGGWLLNEGLKQVFHRPRPAVARLVEASGYGFPSGHAMVSTAFYGFLAYLVWHNFPRSRLRYFVVFGTVVLVALIGVSRVYLGVHYPGDVIAGFAGGGLWLAGCIYALPALKAEKQHYGVIEKKESNQHRLDSFD